MHEFPAGGVHCSCLQRAHEHDLKECGKLRKAPKINFPVLHPGNNKPSVPLALAIFYPTTTAIISYHPEEIVTPAFLDLFYSWWLIVNSKQRFHPNSIGKAIVCEPWQAGRNSGNFHKLVVLPIKLSML